MRTLLVTGGTGFLGSHLLPMLAQGEDRIIAWGRSVPVRAVPRVEYQAVDNADGSEVKKAAEAAGLIDVIIHLAARIPHGPQDDPAVFAEANITGLKNVLAYGATSRTHLIYASSIDVYGTSPDVPYLETQPLTPATAYGESKVVAETLAQTHKGKVTILRFSQVYGAGESLVKVIPRFIEDVKINRPLTVVAGGTDKRRYLAVEDAVRSIKTVVTGGQAGTYNIAGEEIVSTKDVVALLEKILDRSLEVNDMPGTTTGDRYMGIDRARDELGFAPNVLLEDGLRAYLAASNCV